MRRREERALEDALREHYRAAPDTDAAAPRALVEAVAAEMARPSRPRAAEVVAGQARLVGAGAWALHAALALLAVPCALSGVGVGTVAAALGAALALASLAGVTRSRSCGMAELEAACPVNAQAAACARGLVLCCADALAIALLAALAGPAGGASGAVLAQGLAPYLAALGAGLLVARRVASPDATVAAVAAAAGVCAACVVARTVCPAAFGPAAALAWWGAAAAALAFAAVEARAWLRAAASGFADGTRSRHGALATPRQDRLPERKRRMELTLDRLTREFGPKIAVDRVSATLAPGVYGLLGANGAGKTTLMRMVCGVLRPTSGEVRYDGAPVERMGDAYRALLGYLPQDFGYYPEFTALDFMEYMAALKGLGRRDARDRSLALLERVGLGGEERRRIRTFSGGMRQRLGIAQAVLNDPEVLVLDEPTAGLDPKERVRFRNLIAGFARDKIVLLSTHIVSDVEHIADEILVMRAGSVVLSGSPAELVAEAEGKVWEATVPAARAEALEAALTVGNVRHEEGGRVLLRYVADEPRVPGSAPVEPTLEDLYLYLFRDGAAAGAGAPRASRGAHFKEGRHA